jgi:hypothetical protein
MLHAFFFHVLAKLEQTNNTYFASHSEAFTMKLNTSDKGLLKTNKMKAIKQPLHPLFNLCIKVKKEKEKEKKKREIPYPIYGKR